MPVSSSPYASRVAFTRSLIARLPKLRQIALVGRHASSIDYADCTEHGVAVTTGISGSHVEPAEFTVALMMAARRNAFVPEAVAMLAGAPGPAPSRTACARTHYSTSTAWARSANW